MFGQRRRELPPELAEALRALTHALARAELLLTALMFKSSGGGNDLGALLSGLLQPKPPEKPQ